MPEFAARTGADFASGEQSNTRVRSDEQIELASPNLFSNPDLRDFLAGDEPDNVSLAAPEAPAGWGVAIRELGNPSSRMTIQTAGPLQMVRDFYNQTGPLIEGPEPKDATRKARIAPPVSPRLEVLAQAYKGYRAGVVAVAFGWIVGNRWGRSPLITDPSPRSYITLAAGQGADVPLPASAPEGATGMYIAMTAPQATQNLAATAPLWIQRRMSVQRGVRVTYPLYGPFRREERAPAAGDNRTYIGGANRYPAPRRHYLKSRQELKPDIFTALSYSILTEFGWSLPQGSTDGITTPGYNVTETNAKGVSRVVRHGWFAKLAWFPVGIPREIRTWRPEFLGPDGAWYALNPRSVKQRAEIYSNDPQDFPQGRQPQQVERGRQNQDGDQTGLPVPDTALEAATVALVPDLPPGDYAVRAFWYDEDGRMTRPSPPSVQTVALGQTLRINRPQSGNLVPNADASAIDPVTGEADGWTLAPTANFDSLYTAKGGVRVEDNSGSVVNEDAALTPLSPIPPLILSGDRFGHVRVLLDCDRYVSGAFRVDVQFVNRTSGAVSTVTEIAPRRNSAGRTVVTASVAIAGSLDPNGRPPDIVLPADRGYGRIVIRQLGTTDGARDLDYTAFSFGFFEGLTAPRAYPERLFPKPSAEDPEDLYPPAGTCVIRENPPDSERHADLAGITLNSVEYFGPYNTLPANDYGLTGYQTPVRPGQLYTPSVYVGFKGVSRATGLLETVIKDRLGRILKTNAPLIPNVLGTSPQARYPLSFTVPAGGVSLEISRGLASDGFVSMMGFQLDEGAVATPYTNENAASGYRRITLDTGLPGVPSGSKLDDIAQIQEWISGGATFTNDTATSVTVTFRSTPDDPSDAAIFPVWSAWTEDFEAVPRSRYWQINFALATTDTLQSPLVSWGGIRVVRKNPMLMRSDGSEYERGVQVINMPPITPLRINQELIADNNQRKFNARGVFDKTVSFDLECYSHDTAFALVADAQRGDGTQVVEDSQLSMSYRVHIDPESVSWEVDRDAYWTFDEPHHYIIKAGGIKATVLEMERLR